MKHLLAAFIIAALTISAGAGFDPLQQTQEAPAPTDNALAEEALADLAEQIPIKFTDELYLVHVGAYSGSLIYVHAAYTRDIQMLQTHARFFMSVKCLDKKHRKWMRRGVTYGFVYGHKSWGSPPIVWWIDEALCNKWVGQPT